MPNKTKSKLFFIVTIAFGVLMNFPVISIFNKEWTVGVVPVLYVYIFGVWAIAIAFLFFIGEIKKEK